MNLLIKKNDISISLPSNLDSKLLLVIFFFSFFFFSFGTLILFGFIYHLSGNKKLLVTSSQLDSSILQHNQDNLVLKEIRISINWLVSLSREYVVGVCHFCLVVSC